MRQNFSETVALETDGYEGLTAALQQGWERICKNVVLELNRNQLQ
jgi:uncharacterized lipoprotein YmbA